MLITLGNPPSDAETDAWHAVISAAHVRDFPASVPEPSRTATAGRLRVAGAGRRGVHLAEVAADGSYEGVASLLLHTEGRDAHAAFLDVLVVHPSARRRGTGARLWAAMRDILVAEGRTTVSTVLDLGGAGEAFVDSLGFGNALPLGWYVQRVEHALRDVPEPRLPDGLRFVHWTGQAPENLVDRFAAAHNAMADAPGSDLPGPAPRWDRERMRAAARLVGDRGGVLLSAAVVDAGRDDAVLAYSEVVLEMPETTRALQYDTVVLPPHRGRGLGRAVKRHLLSVVHELHPGVREISTTVADDNAPMLALNAALGYRRERSAGVFRLKL